MRVRPVPAACQVDREALDAAYKRSTCRRAVCSTLSSKAHCYEEGHKCAASPCLSAPSLSPLRLAPLRRSLLRLLPRSVHSQPLMFDCETRRRPMLASSSFCPRRHSLRLATAMIAGAASSFAASRVLPHAAISHSVGPLGVTIPLRLSRVDRSEPAKATSTRAVSGYHHRHERLTARHLLVPQLNAATERTALAARVGVLARGMVGVAKWL